MAVSMRWKAVLSGWIVLVGVLALVQSGCWNPFAPEIEPAGNDPVELPSLTSAENVFVNLDYAMNHKDIEIFEEVLDEDYTFFEPSLTDTVDFYWGKADDVHLVGRVYAFYDVIDYSLELGVRRYTEYGSNIAPAGAKEISDEHPDENWEVFLRPVNMLLLDETRTNGASINMEFEFKMCPQKDRDPDTGQLLWRIVRWIDHP
jgi:hypothetical protein